MRVTVTLQKKLDPIYGPIGDGLFHQGWRLRVAPPVRATRPFRVSWRRVGPASCPARYSITLGWCALHEPHRVLPPRARPIPRRVSVRIPVEAQPDRGLLADRLLQEQPPPGPAGPAGPTRIYSVTLRSWERQRLEAWRAETGLSVSDMLRALIQNGTGSAS